MAAKTTETSIYEQNTEKCGKKEFSLVFNEVMFQIILMN